MRVLGHSLAMSLFGLSSLAVGQLKGIHPITNMCERFDHQSTIKDNVLYIYGGNERFVDINFQGNVTGNITKGFNTYFIEVDLKSSWDWKLNISEELVTKGSNPATGTSPPTLVQGALFHGSPDQKNIYLYGGTTSFYNYSFPGYLPPYTNQYSLWEFNTENKAWDQFDVTLNSPERPNSGAYTEAPGLQQAYYLNGKIDNGSSPTTLFLKANDQFLGGMVVLDLSTKTSRNISTSSISGSSPRVKAQLHYIPNYGSKGVLVLMGGGSKSASDVSDDDVGQLVSFDTVDVFDVASLDNGGEGKWYQQKTTGDIPAPRIDSCIVGVAAPDNSSYNIYLYGGRTQTDMFDNIYILSVPQFRWIKYFQGYAPRYGMRCHLVANRQMLTVGGRLNIDEPNVCDWESKGVAILDISTKQWGSVYNANAPPYVVPAEVLGQLGGTPNFTSPEVARLFGPKTNATVPINDSGPSSGSSLSGGAIAGIAIGIVAALAIIAGIIWWIRRRKNGGTGTPLAEMEPNEIQEKDSAAKPTDQKHGLAAELQASDARYHEIGGTVETARMAELPGHYGSNELPGSHRSPELEGSPPPAETDMKVSPLETPGHEGEKRLGH